jgi:predicted O-linked N-acetylglucosamine transferase (SPINDLY family)
MQAPAELEAVFEQSLALLRLGRLDEARGVCESGLNRRPADFSLLHLGGIIALQAHEPARAVELIGEAIRVKSDSPAAHSDYGDALFDLRRYSAAIESYGRAITLQPDLMAAHNNRGLAFWCLRQHRTAIENYDRAIQIDPRNAEAHNYRGHALRDLAEYPAAIESYDSAIAIKPDYAEAYNGRGSALAAKMSYEAAVASFDQAIAIHGDFAEAYLNRGNALRELNRLDEASASYDRAVAMRPGFAEAHYRLGDLQRMRGRLEAALACYDRAVALKRDLTLLLGMRCHARMHLCDWREFDADVAELTASIERGETTCPPMAVLAFSGSAALQRRAAQVFVESTCPPDALPPSMQPRAQDDRIRIGYFSPDFREHPVAYLTAELFESHDRGAFDVTAFSLGPGVGDPMSRRLKAAFGRFLDVGSRSDRDVAQIAQSLQLDIAVDLCGFTEGCRPSIFAKRAAPLQVSYIGYLGTMAAPYIDYMVADESLIPPACRQHYAEKIIRLPSYQANDSQRRIAACDPGLYGLPRSGMVFCCFNNTYKITPGTFASWMRILTRVPDSVLFLYAPHAPVITNLRREAAIRGVDPDRLIFGKTLPRPEYLARFMAADLFLDTLPYNAGTTASDALWAGLPVLTCTGETFAGRMAASLLTSARIPELITSTEEEYEALAVELGRDRNRLAEIKRRVSDRKRSAPLFDVRQFTRNLESAYRAIHERHRAGLPPDDLDIRVQQ